MRGTLSKVGREHVLRFERFYPHPREEVWAALIEPERLAHWFPAAIVGERRAELRRRDAELAGVGHQLAHEAQRLLGAFSGTAVRSTV